MRNLLVRELETVKLSCYYILEDVQVILVSFSYFICYRIVIHNNVSLNQRQLHRATPTPITRVTGVGEGVLGAERIGRDVPAASLERRRMGKKV